jgi:hypothetical protein
LLEGDRARRGELVQRLDGQTEVLGGFACNQPAVRLDADVQARDDTIGDGIGQRVERVAGDREERPSLGPAAVRAAP